MTSDVLLDIAMGGFTVCAVSGAPPRPVIGRAVRSYVRREWCGYVGRGSLQRGPRAPSHAVDLAGLVADHVPHPPAVHAARGGAAAAGAAAARQRGVRYPDRGSGG